jgi:sec-independent protein translocase protein TatA
MSSFGWQELLIILGIVLLLFGATRLPLLGKSIGQSIRGFRSGLKGDEAEPKKLEEGESAEKEPAAKKPAESEPADKKPDEPVEEE